MKKHTQGDDTLHLQLQSIRKALLHFCRPKNRVDSTYSISTGSSDTSFALQPIGFFFFFMYDIQHCFISRPSDSTVSEDAGIEPRTVATTALAVRRSNHSARSHQLCNLCELCEVCFRWEVSFTSIGRLVSALIAALVLYKFSKVKGKKSWI